MEVSSDLSSWKDFPRTPCAQNHDLRSPTHTAGLTSYISAIVKKSASIPDHSVQQEHLSCLCGAARQSHTRTGARKRPDPQ